MKSVCHDEGQQDVGGVCGCVEHHMGGGRGGRSHHHTTSFKKESQLLEMLDLDLT